MHSLKDELAFFVSGKGMPYEKVSLVVAIVVTVVIGIFLANNYTQDANVAVIDLDNSKYSHEIIEKMNASPFIKISAVLNMPAEPTSLFYRDKNIAVVYLPKDLEKNRYSQSAASMGVFYDNTNSAQTVGVKDALNTIIASENQTGAAQNPAAVAAAAASISLNERELFNPVNSNSNGEVLGFLFFFSSMFFVFATIGIIPRLRLEKKLVVEFKDGSPFSLITRLFPYSVCLVTAIFVGLAILRILGDLTFSGNIFVFLLSLIFYIPALGMFSLLFGWTAANPGVAASRMILFIPGGFIFGGPTGPVSALPEWVRIITHIFFPLTWEYHFTRDILTRGASFMDCSKEFGALLIYLGVVALVFCFCFYRARAAFMKIKEQKNSIIAEG
ncbi:MAG: ABC transporter permease [Veillonellales bacterium]